MIKSYDCFLTLFYEPQQAGEKKQAQNVADRLNDCRSRQHEGGGQRMVFSLLFHKRKGGPEGPWMVPQEGRRVKTIIKMIVPL